MLKDVFYLGSKPNAHPRERPANSVHDAREQCTTDHFWIITSLCDYRGFDWDWDFEFLSDELVWAQEHNNVWPSQHQKDSGTWLCPKEDSDIILYRADVDPVIRKNELNDNWKIAPSIDTSLFDFSWHPDPTSPPYIYQFGYEFGTLLDENDGPTYVTENNDGTVVYFIRTDILLEDINFPKYYIQTTLDDLIVEHSDEIFWALNKDIDYDNFDFRWRPNKQNVYHINVFGSHESIMTQTYFVNGKMWQQGYRDLNFIESAKLDEQYLSTLFKKIDAVFIDKGNSESQHRYEQLKIRFPNLQKTRYLNSWVDTINRCVNKVETTLFWVLNSELDYSQFEFDFYPTPWQMNMTHVFGTQWSHWGTTFVVNKDSFTNDTKYVKIIEHLPNLHFVKHATITATNCLHDVYVVDHGNTDTLNVVEQITRKVRGKTVSIIKYDDSYLSVFKKILDQVEKKNEHYIWVCSSVCDYSNFDFTYICDPYAKEDIHVFPSSKQKFGDTFFININALSKVVDSMVKLEDYKKLNYNQHQKTTRLLAPKFVSNSDNHFNNLTQAFNFPYATFVTNDHLNLTIAEQEPMSLWDRTKKSIIVNSTGASVITVPQEVTQYVKKEFYDYPHIVKATKLTQSNPLDIVFLSNGEMRAEENYEHLLEVTKHTKNRVVRVDGVNGRVAAYHAALEASETPWAFTVFAKLKISEEFDWSWQPDRLQQAKHYIFYATNPLNGLEYGHQAMIAYNKKLTLVNSGTGLDFTLDDEHEVVELNSGIAQFNTDEWSTWRTSFRECIKLKKDNSPTSQHRLNIWLTIAEGEYAEMCIKGARDAVQYYEEVGGDIDKLKLSYDWPWLREKFNNVR
jgi:hypothetical protein